MPIGLGELASIDAAFGNPVGKIFNKTWNKVKEASPFKKVFNSGDNPIHNKTSYSSHYHGNAQQEKSVFHNQILSERTMGGLNGKPYNPSFLDKTKYSIEKN